MNPTAYPLQWPVGFPRTHDPENSRFKVTLGEAIRHLYRQLELMGAAAIVVSSNMEMQPSGRPYARQRNIEDTGVAVYFVRDGRQLCVPCDKWVHVAENVRAIGLTIEALRSLDRYGAKETVDAAFAGFAALPATAGAVDVQVRPWWEVLGVASDATQAEIHQAYRAASKRVHPNVGGSLGDWNELRRAYAEAKSTIKL